MIISAATLVLSLVSWVTIKAVPAIFHSKQEDKLVKELEYRCYEGKECTELDEYLKVKVQLLTPQSTGK